MADLERIRVDDDDALEAIAGVLNVAPPAGQPRVCKEMVRQTLTRENISVDTGFYERLAFTGILGMRRRGVLLGAIAFGDNIDGGRELLWAGASDDRFYPELVAGALEGWDGPVRACGFAPTVALALEGHPAGCRPGLHHALMGAGFEGSALWSYQVAFVEPSGDPVASLETIHGTVRADGREVADFAVSTPFPGIGLVWWIGVPEPHRGRGHGREAIIGALDIARSRGAQTVVALVDDDEPGGGRDRTASLATLRKAGFVEWDRLWTYTR